MLNSNSKKEHFDKPYKYFVIDNFLNEDSYKSIRRDFYSAISDINDWHEEYGIAFSNNHKLMAPIFISGSTAIEDSHSYLSKYFKKESHGYEFITKLLDKNFIEAIIGSKLLPLNAKIHKASKKIGLFEKLFYDNFNISLKISRSSPGSGIAIHPDNYPKRISMLLYFGWSDNKERKLGGTQLYEAEDGFNPEPHYFFSHDNFNLHKNIFPIENRLMGFVAEDNSWHGVNPDETRNLMNENITRDVLQINLVKHTNYGGFLNLITAVRNYIKNKIN
jgi:hypothetical protein